MEFLISLGHFFGKAHWDFATWAEKGEVDTIDTIDTIDASVIWNHFEVSLKNPFLELFPDVDSRTNPFHKGEVM